MNCFKDESKQIRLLLNTIDADLNMDRPYFAVLLAVIISIFALKRLKSSLNLLWYFSEANTT